MKRSPFFASSRWAVRATVVSSFLSPIECRNTLRMVPLNVSMLSTNTTRLARRNSLKSPGATTVTSSFCSSCCSYSILRRSAHGDRNSDSATITSRNGTANSRMGRSEAVNA